MAVPRVTVAAMVVVPVPVPVAEHPAAVAVADATRVSAAAHVQAGSALGSSAGDLEGELGALAPSRRCQRRARGMR